MPAKLAHIGQHYRDLSVEISDAHWLVVAIYRSVVGIDHVLLRSTRDGSVQRTLALSVLTDPKRFALVV